MNTEFLKIKTIDNEKLSLYRDGLAELLKITVEDGASVGFVVPFSLDKSQSYWESNCYRKVESGENILLVAEYQGNLVGTVQLELGTPENQPHRAEVAKLLVNPRYRKKGVAKALMKKLESLALKYEKSLLTLDTRTGDKAEGLYIALGFEVVGTIPNFAKDPIEERFDATTVMYKRLYKGFYE